jgi:UDP-glucuronate decarboxylase
MPTSLVTGGAGFLGSHLCDYLLARGHRVVCIDNLDTGSLENISHIATGVEFRFEMIDITDHYEIDEPVDFVYHMASPASPIDYSRLPLHTLKVGAYGTHNTLGLAKKHRARFLLASTSEVYGDPLVHPQPETYWGNVNPIGPRGVYDEAKRYAEALTMAYRRQQGVDTGIVRIFNSIVADEQVLYDDGRELHRESVEELALRLERAAVTAGYVDGSGPVTCCEAAEYPLRGVTVPAFGPGGGIRSAPADALVAHPTERPCYEVTTRHGRSIKVTADHSVFVHGPDGEPTPKPVDELSVGEPIAIAGRIEVPERDRTELSMLDVWRFAEGDPWQLSIEVPKLGEQVWAQRADLFGLLVSQPRNAGRNWRNGAWSRLIRMRETDRVPLPVLRRLVSSVPEGALVRAGGGRVALPARVDVSDELLWLLGLWVAEGCTHERGKTAVLQISCEPALLDRAARILESHFGVRPGRTQATPSVRAATLYVNSKLLLRVWDYLGFDDNRKRIPGWILGLPLSRLKWFLEGYRQGDGVRSGAKRRAGVGHEFSTVFDELKDDLVVAFARFGLVPSVGMYETTFKQRSGGRRYPFWRLTLSHVTPWNPLEWDRGVTQRLQARRHGDLVWSPVRKIERIEPTTLVYDFSVPGHENFWAGTGVLAHNTFGSKMRPHDGRAVPTFLRQALTDRPLTVFGDGSQTRSFCYVDDLIRGIVSLAESGLHDPMNLGNPDEMTLIELAQAIIELTESRSEIVYEALPVDDPQVRQPDITRARELLGWEPEIDFREGLRRTIEHYQVVLQKGATR